MRTRSALLYSALRLLVFLVPFGVLMLLPVFWESPWLAAIFAALIGLSLSIIFLRRPLDHFSAGLSQRRPAQQEKARDETAEDELAADGDAGADGNAGAEADR